MEINLSIKNSLDKVFDKQALTPLLASFPFKYIERSELEMLLLYSELKHFKKGETVVLQGKKADGIYILLQGKAIAKSNVLGYEINHITHLEASHFVGEESLLTSSPCFITVEAEQDLLCLKISAEYFMVLGVSFPNIKYKMLKGMMEKVLLRLEKFKQQIETLATKQKKIFPAYFSQLPKLFSAPRRSNLEEIYLSMDTLYETLFHNFFTLEEYNILIKLSKLIKTEVNYPLPRNKNPDFYIIIRGAVQSNISVNDSWIKISILSIMDFFSDSWGIDNYLISYSTCERTILLKIPAENLVYIQKNTISLWYKIYNLISISLIRIEQATAKLAIRLKSENI